MTSKALIKSQAFKDFSIIFILLGIITLIFNVTNLDIKLQAYFYSSSEGWFLKFKPFWDYFYRYGIFPGYLFGLAGLVMIAVSYWNTKYVQYRRAAFMLVYTLVLGPGIIINLGLKDHWGRPRPFEIKEFGGKQQFLCVCVLGQSEGGKSFPCGHCSMGFFLAVPYLIFRKRKRKLAYTFLISGVLYGLLIGLSRMIAGGHFPSDILWSGGIVWLVALTGTYIFKLDQPLKVAEMNAAGHKQKARLATIIVSMLLIMISLGLMLATPYISQKSISISSNSLIKEKTIAVIADFKDATVELVEDTSLNITYKVNAFGFPNSKIRGRITNGDTIHYQIQWMGWFTEVSNSIRMGIPSDEKITYILKVNKGKIFCHMPDNGIASFDLFLNKGDLFLTVNPDNYLLLGDSNILINNTGKPVHWVNPVLNQKSGQTVKFTLLKGRVVLQ